MHCCEKVIYSPLVTFFYRHSVCMWVCGADAVVQLRQWSSLQTDRHRWSLSIESAHEVPASNMSVGLCGVLVHFEAPTVRSAGVCELLLVVIVTLPHRANINVLTTASKQLQRRWNYWRCPVFQELSSTGWPKNNEVWRTSIKTCQ